MKRLLSVLVVALALLVPTAAAAEPIRMTEFVRIKGHRFPIYLELYLEPAGETRIAAKVAGNIRAIQVNLPGLMSGVVDEQCNRKITLQLDQARPEGDHIRLLGRVQLISYSCNAAEEYESRRRRLSNTTDVDVLLDGGIRDNCLRANLEELTIQPGGLIGGIMNLLNLTEKVSETVRSGLNDSLNNKDMCFDLPPVLEVLNAHISSGGFRDFGGGDLGFVIKGRADLTAAGVIDLIEMLPEPGGKDCRCD